MGEYRSQIKPLYGTPINPLHWASAGLVGQWTMNEGSGLIAHDSSGNGNHGTLINMSNTPTSGWVPGPQGGALAFDSASKYIDCGFVNRSDWVNLTTVSWFYWISGDLGYAGVYNKTTVDIGRLLIADYGQILIQNGNGNFKSIGANDVLRNKWTNIIYTYNQGQGQEYIYVDSILKGQKGRTGNIVLNNNNSLKLGQGQIPASYGLNGFISSVSIYNRALSAEEIAYLYTFPYCFYEDQAPISLQGGNASAMNYYQQLLAGGQ